LKGYLGKIYNTHKNSLTNFSVLEYKHDFNLSNAMQQHILIICFSLLSHFNTLGQSSLTKDQIYEYWNLSREQGRQCSKKAIFNEDSLTNSILIKFVDSLKIAGVDSIIILSGYPLYIREQACVLGSISFPSHIFWNKSGETFFQSFNNKCSSSYIKIESQLFYFHKNIIQNEVFMPVIFSGFQQIDGNIFFEMSIIFHEPSYTFYYSVGNDSNSYHFSYNDIEDQKSLFHGHNLSLSAYKWWEMVKRQIDSENKK
jgi:hypothetical protein